MVLRFKNHNFTNEGRQNILQNQQLNFVKEIKKNPYRLSIINLSTYRLSEKPIVASSVRYRGATNDHIYARVAFSLARHFRRDKDIRRQNTLEFVDLESQIW